jgi:release factor glutamine methyltransferase
MMPSERVERLRAWHEAALCGGRRDETLTVEVQRLSLVVPPGVYPPNPLGLADIVVREVLPADRVLDMGTGSGVNGLVAAALGAEVVGVDVNPEAVACAQRNADRNDLAGRFTAWESDVFSNVDGRFDVIAFDPPFRWFPARSMAERGTADDNYDALTRFFRQVKDHLTPHGRACCSPSVPLGTSTTCTI